MNDLHEPRVRAGTARAQAGTALLMGPLALDFEQQLALKSRPVRNGIAGARVTAAELKLLEEAAHAEGKLLAEMGARRAAASCPLQQR